MLNASHVSSHLTHISALWDTVIPFLPTELSRHARINWPTKCHTRSLSQDLNTVKFSWKVYALNQYTPSSLGYCRRPEYYRQLTVLDELGLFVSKGANGTPKMEIPMTIALPRTTLLLFRCPVMSKSFRPHGLQHARLPCPSPTPKACSNSCSLNWWHHPTISSSVVPFSCLQSFQHQGFFKWVSSLHQVDKTLEFQLQSFHRIFRIDFLWN